MALAVNNYKNIIFDLGGVILNIDYQLTEQAFKNMNCSGFETNYSKAKQTSLFDDFETGKINESGFIDGMKKLFELETDKKSIIDAWNAMLLDLPNERLDFLLRAKKNYRTFLLSNTNETHIRAFEEIISSTHGIDSLEPYFERVYFSCRIGMRKPNAEIFEYVLNENKLNATETLFIDDSLQHIEGALSCGIHAILLDRNIQLNQLPQLRHLNR